MDPRHKNLLQVNRSNLVSHISDIKSVVEMLFEMKTITANMKEDLIEVPMKTKTDQKRDLLDMMPKRGPRAFEEFVTALKRCEEWEALEILKPGEGRAAEAAHKMSLPAFTPPTQSTIASPVEEDLPQEWPCESYSPMYVDVKEVDRYNESMMRKFADCSNPNSQFYCMQKNTRGKVLIINNKDFSSARNTKMLELLDREGTDMDATSLDILFEKLNFKVETVDNQTAEGIWTTLSNASKEDYSAHDCFICFFLSHGRGGEIFGTDGGTVKIQELTDLFNSQNCQSLSTKPKLFFVQACQGNKADTGSQGAVAFPSSVQQSSEPDQEVSLRNKGEKEVDELLKGLKDVNLKDSETASDAESERNVPTRADIFVAFATTPDYLSYRNTLRGTWFIQAITYVFQKFACVNDINQLMTKVNFLVSRAEHSKTKHKQISKSENSFIKQFYFFPGLVSDPGAYNQVQPSS